MRASELTNRRELKTFRDGVALNGGTPQVWDLSAPEGKGVSTTELQELITHVSYLYIQRKLEGFNCARYRNCAILRLCTGAALSRDCAPVPRDLEIA